MPDRPVRQPGGLARVAARQDEGDAQPLVAEPVVGPAAVLAVVLGLRVEDEVEPRPVEPLVGLRAEGQADLDVALRCDRPQRVSLLTQTNG